ncbi:SSU ribosomal protein S1p [Lachnospiraceae bacterium TWA4]|nr:SSU ribosomal protein S1p [Lachnospiraceae bacterium TWA4]
MSEEIKDVVVEETMDTYADQLDKDPVWEGFEQKLKDRTVITVEVAGIVKSGVVAYVDGVRGFIPASQLSADYVEDLDSWLGKMVDVMIIEVKPADKRLILSGKRVETAKAKQDRLAKIDAIEVGAEFEGTVESLQDYGAFVTIADGVSGLVHVSQMSTRRVKSPEDVVSVGDTVKVKVIANEKHKISLSMKALMEAEEEKTPSNEASRDEIKHYKEKGEASTSLKDLLKDFKF